MSPETFSFYGLRPDGSIVRWDFLSFDDEATAVKHATSMVADDKTLAAVEAWSLTGRRLTVPTGAFPDPSAAARSGDLGRNLIVGFVEDLESGGAK